MIPAPVPLLVRPRYAGNVGAVLRATANFGGTKVVLVAPECDLGSQELLRMAMGAQERVSIETAPTLPEALARFPVAVGFTSLRERDPRGVVSVWELPATLAAVPLPAALVFGPERGGLSRQELACCSHLATIPTDPAFSVMNLAQAVAVALAALRRDAFEVQTPRLEEDLPASREEVEKALAHLQEVLLASKFLDPHNPRRVFDQLRRVVGRGLPSGREVKILHALAAHIAFLSRRAFGEEPPRRS